MEGPSLLSGGLVQTWRPGVFVTGGLGGWLVITVPAALQWAVELVAGQSWPDSDEDALRRLGDEWAAVGRELADKDRD